MAVPSRSTVSSKAVWERTGANTASGGAGAGAAALPRSAEPAKVSRTSPAHSRSKPRKRSQSVTLDWNAFSSTSAAFR